MGFELKNVLDQLKEIAENNDSEDVARAIETANKYSFKDRLAEMENASVYEMPGDEDDQYCANCGNTGYSLHTTGEACPNCDDGEGEGKGKDKGKDETWNRIADRVSDRDNDDADLEQMSKNAGIEETGDATEDMGLNAATDGGALDRVIDRSQERGGAVDQVCDRVAERGDDDLGDDPWGIGEDAFDDWHEKHDAGFEDAPDDDDFDDDLEEDGKEGSAIDRVVGRSHRSGDGGPVSRVQGRHAERFAAIDEEIGKVFNTSMERHSWIMNQLNDMTSDMTPEDAAMVKNLLKTAGNADVKGGNC